MSRIIHISTPQWIVVDVLNLLPHHLVRLDNFRVTTFLPKLMGLIDFVSELVESQFLQKRFVTFFLHPLDDGGRCEGFELSDTLVQLRANADPMQVIFHDHKCVHRDVTLSLEESPAFKDHIRKFRPGEHREPSDNRVCHEVGVVVVAKAIARARHGGRRSGKSRDQTWKWKKENK